MRTLALRLAALGLVLPTVAVPPSPANAAGASASVLFDGRQTLNPSELADHSVDRVATVGDVRQTNTATTTATNENNQIVNQGPSTMTNGAILPVLITGNRGFSTVMQNTGNLVNMTYTMTVNVSLK